MAVVINGNGTVTGVTAQDELNVDSNTLVVDSTNDRVGVGAGSPSHKLSVSGAGSSGTLGLYSTGTSNELRVEHDGGSNWVINSVSANGIRFKTNNVEEMRILSGGGITFNGDTATANALDDYEEGTFTPDLQFNTGNSGMTYSNRAGYYTKIGNVVTIWGFCVLSNKGTVSGSANIANLPFTPHNAGSNHMFGTFTTANGMSSMPQTNNWVMPYYSGRMYFRYQTSTGEGNITNSHFTNSSNFGFTATYKIN